MRSQIIIISLVLLSLIACQQVPTTLDDQPYNPTDAETEFSADIISFDFDILSWEFFFSVIAASPDDDLEVSAVLSVDGIPIYQMALQDSGRGSDILIHDGRFDGNWILPDSLVGYIDSLWTLDVVATSGGQSRTDMSTVQPEQPVIPLIVNISHLDTLIRPTEGQIRDTIRVEIFLPQGRDSIRDVSFTSLKPDSTYANNGQPIPLYDDGGALIFSGDKIAGDGIYSLILPLEDDHLTGIYHWTFYARTWLGQEADPVADSLVVIPSESILRSTSIRGLAVGAFQ